jgi:hypothetical protein
LGGCGTSSELPPGGAQAVAYWQQVLLQYPDLPDRVRDIVEERGQQVANHGISQAMVRIYGEDGEHQIAGRRINVLVTDLDHATLRKLLEWWEAVPRLAEELEIPAILPFQLPESTQHVVVLGSEGRIEVSGPGGSDQQTIKILHDDVAGRMFLDVHLFGQEGQATLDHLANQYRTVRGPPRSAVRAGNIGLPPPDEVTVLVIGELNTLNIEGASDDAVQQISFTSFLNQHRTSGVQGTLAGSPFPIESSEAAPLETAWPAPAHADTGSSYSGASSNGSYSSSTSGYVPTPQTPSFDPSPSTFTPPRPWTPPPDFGRQFTLPPPTVVVPRTPTPAPVTRFR